MPVGYTTLVAEYLQDASGDLIATATLYLVPVSSVTGVPISFRAGGNGGAVMVVSISAPIVDGAVTLQVLDTALTYPVNIGYAATIIDNNGNSLLGPGYECLQPTGATWSLDAFEPDLGGLVTVQNGPQGLPGAPGSIYGTVLDQVPSGTIDGVNVTFTIAGTPAIVYLFRNGVKEPKTNYSLAVNGNNTVITFIPAAVPQPPNPAQGFAGDALEVLGISSTAPSGSSSSSSPVSSLQLTDTATGQVRTLTVSNGTLELA